MSKVTNKEYAGDQTVEENADVCRDEFDLTARLKGGKSSKNSG